MKKILLVAIACLSFQSLHAFSPLDQSAIEICDIVSSPTLRRFIPPHEVILDIRRVPNGYLITTNHYQVFVEVRYRLKAGAAQPENQKKEYDIKFNEPTQISGG